VEDTARRIISLLYFSQIFDTNLPDRPPFSHALVRLDTTFHNNVILQVTHVILHSQNTVQIYDGQHGLRDQSDTREWSDNPSSRFGKEHIQLMSVVWSLRLLRWCFFFRLL
jgi:hypothetical protein